MSDTPADRPGVARRRLLQGAIAAPAALAVPGLVAGTGAPTAAAAPVVPPTPGGFDPDSPRFALAVLPDTQYLFDEDRSDPEPLATTFRYLAEQRGLANVAFMTHLGDVTEHGTQDEIELAGRTFEAIDGVVPFSVLAGNHDVPGGDDQRGDTPYLRAFGPSRFAGSDTFGGSSPDGYNSFHVIPAAGREWLVLALDWRISDAGLAWARGVVDAHAQLPAIVTTHDLAYADDAGAATLSGHGQRLWDGLIRGKDQIVLALGGHYWPPGRTVLSNDAGHDVHVHITNYQDRYYGGAGMIRLYQFDLVRNTIDVETFAPWFLTREAGERPPLGAEVIELTGDVDRFSLPVDFAARFAGFAPDELPPSRPPTRVVGRDTVAYWRFDTLGLRGRVEEGVTVSDGAVAHDLTRKGNDLVVRRLHLDAPGLLTRSLDHHDGAPAHASLRFDGGKSPDRGAILEAVAAAPSIPRSSSAATPSNCSSSCPNRSRATTPGWVCSAGRAGPATRARRPATRRSSRPAASTCRPSASCSTSSTRTSRTPRRRRGATPSRSAAGSTSPWSTTGSRRWCGSRARRSPATRSSRRTASRRSAVRSRSAPPAGTSVSGRASTASWATCGSAGGHWNRRSS